MSTTDTAEPDVSDPESLGLQPIFDALLSWQDPDGHVREVFGLGHRDQLPIVPDRVHDPVCLVAHARLIGTTPTLALGEAVVTRTMSMAEAMAWHDEQRYLASLADRSLMGQDA